MKTTQAGCQHSAGRMSAIEKITPDFYRALSGHKRASAPLPTSPPVLTRRAYCGGVLGVRMNNRRKLTFALGACVAAAPLVSLAQKKPARVYRIGVLNGGSAASAASFGEELKHGLRELGYVEGKSFILERRYGEGKADRLTELAAELVRIKVDVIVASTDASILAVKQETETIPIVMAASTDPVGTGFVASLARPGGNVTGLSMMSPELSGKRLELLSEVVPGISRVAFLWNPDVRGALFEYKETESAART